MTQRADITEDVRYIRGRVDEIRDEQAKQGERVAALEVKSGLWGFLGGFLAFIGIKLGAGQP